MTFTSAKIIFPFLGVILLTGIIASLVLPHRQSEKSRQHHTPAKPPPLTQSPSYKATKTAGLPFNPKTRSLLENQNNHNFTQQLSQTYGFAIDPRQQKLYWTSSGDESFKRAELDGSHIEDIQSNFEAPYHIAIENSFGTELYYYSDGAIRRRVIDTQIGTDTEALLLKTPMARLHGLGYDESLNQLYLGDEHGQIHSIVELPSSESDQVKVRTIAPTTNQRNTK